MCYVISRTYSSTRFVIEQVDLFPRKADRHRAGLFKLWMDGWKWSWLIKAGGWKRPFKWEQIGKRQSGLEWALGLDGQGFNLLAHQHLWFSIPNSASMTYCLAVWGMQEEVGLEWSHPVDKCLFVLAPSKNLMCNRLNRGLSKILSLFGISCFNLQDWWW